MMNYRTVLRDFSPIEWGDFLMRFESQPAQLCAVFPGAREGVLSRTDVLHRAGSPAALRAVGYQSGIGTDG